MHRLSHEMVDPGQRHLVGYLNEQSTDLLKVISPPHCRADNPAILTRPTPPA